MSLREGEEPARDAGGPTPTPTAGVPHVAVAPPEEVGIGSLDTAAARLAALARRAADDSPDSALPTRDEMGRELYAALQALDTAHEQLRRQQRELDQAREQLGAEHARFRELFEVAREGYVLTDPAGIIRESNRTAAALLNIPPHFMVGKPLAVFVEPDDRRLFRVHTYRARVDGAETEWTAWLRPRNGTPTLLSFAVVPTADPRGNVTALRWLLRDVSGRRAEEVHDRAPAALVRAALDALSAHIAVLDADGRIMTVNRAWRATRSPAGLFPRGAGPGTDYLAACMSAAAAGQSAADVARVAVERVLGGGEPRADVLYSVPVADGEAGDPSGEYAHDAGDRWFALRVARCDGESTARAIVAHEDVTAERRAFERERALLAERAARLAAEGANEAKSQFLATLSHELRTPLNAIGGYAELLAMGVRGPVNPQQAEDLRRILRSEQHLLALINELLNFARLERGEIQFDCGPVTVDPIVGEVVELLVPQAAAKSVDLAAETKSRPIVARADAEKVRQILVNLVANAVRFTPTGGAIRVFCTADDGTARIAVRDTGVGIAPTKLEAIFDPFVQLHRGSAGQSEGVGLGLAISRNLARAMHGDLTVVSAPGAGSTFTLSLPRVHSTGGTSREGHDT